MYANKFYFKHPVRVVVSGPSASGKTEFIKKVIDYKNDLFTTPVNRVIFVYKYAQTWFGKYSTVEFTKEVPQYLDPQEASLIIIDDVVCESSALKECTSLFVRGSHHMNASVFFITQNLFAPSADYRSISLNASHFVLFKTLRGVNQIEHFGRQIFGKSESKNFFKVYKNATEKPFTYLLLDLEPCQEYRLRTNIFPGEQEAVYILE